MNGDKNNRTDMFGISAHFKWIMKVELERLGILFPDVQMMTQQLD